MKRLTLGLTPTQITLCVGLFMLTSIGAFALAWWFRRRNRTACNTREGTPDCHCPKCDPQNPAHRRRNRAATT